MITDTSSAMADLMKDGVMKPLPKTGDLVEGTVISVSKHEVLINIPGITTGVVRGEELYDESGEYTDLKQGDLVTATVTDLENEMGYIECSFRSAGHKRAWSRLKELMDKGDTLDAKILSANKGGLMVEVERIAGFLPVSQLSPEHYPRVQGGDKQKILEKINQYVHQAFRVKIIDIDEKENKLIVSEKKAYTQHQQERLNQFKAGDTVDGTISGVTDFGAFLRFGEGLEGLIHISELSWQRLDHPSQIVKVGDQVQARILTIEESKISLSRKQLEDDPWKNIDSLFHIGQMIQGAVTKVQPFGFFVEIAPQIQGLVHISELDLGPGQTPASVARVGDKMELQIISIEPSQHRLGLSRKLLTKTEAKTESTEQPVVDSKETVVEPIKEEAPVETKTEVQPE